jgi:fatty-acyl-CoA synthase
MSVAAPPTFPAADDAVRRWAALAPARAALVEHDAADGRWTYARLDGRADARRDALAAAGVGAGDRVALLAGTRAECVALFHGCLRRGAVLVPLNWRLAPGELARVLADARPALLVAEGRHAALADRALAHPDAAPAQGVRRLALDAGGAADAPPAVDAAAAHADAATMLLYTSGSTGTPKGVVLPRRQLLFNAVATCAAWRLGADEVVPVATPLFHTGGWHVYLTPALHAGATAVLFDGWDADAFLEGIVAHGCTRVFGVPTQLTLLLESARWGAALPALCERLQHVISGGAPLPPTVRAALAAAGLRVREGYGLTECGPNCFAADDALAAAHPGAVGVPIPFLEMRLADEAGRPVPDGTPGELLLRGPQMFAGYFGRPDDTAAALTPDGFLRTGDLAVRERAADRDAGVYRVCGRRKEMYISGGENVFPGEVEAVLAGCPGVLEAAVVGVPDARWGEVGCAFVVARDGATADGGARAAMAARVAAHARAALAGYKVPRRVEVLTAPLPRLGSGKVDRRALAARAVDGADARLETVG